MLYQLVGLYPEEVIPNANRDGHTKIITWLYALSQNWISLNGKDSVKQTGYINYYTIILNDFFRVSNDVVK